MAALLMPVAHAQLMSTLTTGAISGSPFGTVTVNDINPDEVQVTLTLTAGDFTSNAIPFTGNGTTKSRPVLLS